MVLFAVGGLMNGKHFKTLKKRDKLFKLSLSI
jgi:hypothetical protein